MNTLRCIRIIVGLMMCSDTFANVGGFGSSHNGHGVKSSMPIECPPADNVCELDKFGFEAIGQLHIQIDDDGNGNLDRSESDEFLRDELKYEDDFERHSTFHGNDDLISVSDLWIHWVKSEVYNWTTDDVLEWLVEDLELPQYIDNFKLNEVDGHALPRIAANSQYTTNILGIKNPIHRQKISLKAMDVVLFGAPKRGHNYLKDLVLIASLVIAVGGCWLAYVQHSYSQSHLRKVMKDLDALQRSEDTLTTLQKKLDEAQKKQQSAMDEKNIVETKMKSEIDTAKQEAERLRVTREATEEEISRLRLAEEELAQVRMALRRAEREIEERHNAPLAELQQWLQLTYEVENTHYETKREAAEFQLGQAKEMCEKIRKKRGAFLGSLRIAHTTSIDNTDDTILKARAALEDIKNDLQERSQRWSQIEKICGFNIMMNPGIQFLESHLRGGSGFLGSRTPVGLAPCDVETADEDLPPGYLSNAATTSLAGTRLEPFVWPSLMNAGMQLTMIPGLGPSNNQASMPYVPNHCGRPIMSSMYGTMSDLRERRTPVTPVGSSTTGLNSLSGMPGPAPMAGRNARKVTRSEPMMRGSDNDTPPDSDGSAGESHGRDTNGGPVIFNLGDSSISVATSTEKPATIPRNHSFSKSVSLEASKPLARPKTLPSSLSDSSLSGRTIKRVNAGVPKRTSGLSINSGNQTPTLAEEEDEKNGSVSGTESTDSSLLSEDKKKKKKSKLLRKLLGKDSDKSK